MYSSGDVNHLLNAKLQEMEGFDAVHSQGCTCCAGLLIVMFNPLFKLSDSHLPAPVILFATFGGLRGAVSLILAQMLVSQQDQQQKSRDMLQTAQVTCSTQDCVFFVCVLMKIRIFVSGGLLGRFLNPCCCA